MGYNLLLYRGLFGDDAEAMWPGVVPGDAARRTVVARGLPWEEIQTRAFPNQQLQEARTPEYGNRLFFNIKKKRFYKICRKVDSVRRGRFTSEEELGKIIGMISIRLSRKLTYRVTNWVTYLRARKCRADDFLNV
jgi:hypothetical protein